MSTAAKIDSTSGPKVVVGRLQRAPREERLAGRAKPTTAADPSRAALMLALAHAIQRAIDLGEIRDQAEAARQLGVAPARMSQLLDLTLLSLRIQEAVLRIEIGGDVSTTERALRKASRHESWALQAEVWGLAGIARLP